MQHPDFVVVDAFIGEGCLGNPAAVAIVETFAPTEELARTARELELPCIFVQLGSERSHIRWFTPDESDFCGHGTLAASRVLLDRGLSPKYTSCAGELAASVDGDWIQLDLPALPLRPLAIPPELSAILGAEVCSLHDASGRIVVEVAHEDVVRRLRPNIAGLRRMFGLGVAVTARGSGEFDFISRFFRKAHNDEDPVTGSAHCALGPFWAERLGKTKFMAFQASDRGGVLRVELRPNARVTVSGRAKVRASGE